MAQKELARVSHIATHTLRFHKQSSNRTEVDLRALSESVLSLYRARLEASRITAVVDCPDNARLVCYEGEIRQILVDLVANAYDAMRMGGRLIIRAHPSRDWKSGVSGIRLLVADSGSGMNAETQRRLFEPFYSTKGIGGTGLGLWISKDLITKNHGVISVRSSSQAGRHGTVFSLFFPASRAQSKASCIRGAGGQSDCVQGESLRGVILLDPWSRSLCTYLRGQGLLR